MSKYFFILLLIASPVFASEATDLLRIEKMVGEGRFDAAKKVAFGLDYNKLTKSERLRYFRMQIHISLAYENIPERDYWTRKHCQADPSTSLDASEFPPEVMDHYKNCQDIESTMPPSVVEKQVPDVSERKNFSLSLMPLGVGSLYQNEPWSGIQFFILESALAGTLDRYYLVSDRADDALILGGSSGGIKIVRSKFLNSSVAIGLFLGLWGWEVSGLLQKLYAIDRGRAHAFDRYLNFAPLGVGQFRNGDHSKGFILLVGELLTASLYYHSERKPKDLKFGYGFLGLWLLGTFDASVSYNPRLRDQKTASNNVYFSPDFMQWNGENYVGLNMAWRF